MLEIKALDEQHNHETNNELFRNLWQQRKLGDEEKESLQQMLNMKANKKIIQSNIMQATGKVDIHNMTVTNNRQNDLTTLQKASSIIDTITKTYSGCYESGLGWSRGGLEVVWGVSTDPDRSYHFTKNISFRG